MKNFAVWGWVKGGLMATRGNAQPEAYACNREKQNEIKRVGVEWATK